MNNMTHIMVDLETLAEGPNAVFPSLAAVQFNINTGQMGKKFSMNIDINSAVAAGLVIDASTIGWWFTQPHEVSALMFHDPQPLSAVLQEFSHFLIDCADGIEPLDQLVLWGNSSRYDLGKLAWAYKSLGYDYPWNTWVEKCYRTYTKLFPNFGNEVKKHDMKHDPIQDCEFQIRKLVAVHNMVQLRMEQHAEVDKGYTEAILLLHEIQQTEHLRLDIREKVKDFMDGKVIIDDPKPSVEKAGPHLCMYSRSIDEPRPRLCKICNEPEPTT
jgi:hypothetical protein